MHRVSPRFADYFTAVLLDFATVDPDLGEQALSAALEWSELSDLVKPFDKFAVKELDLKVRDIKKLRAKISGTSDAMQNGAES